MEYKTDVYVGSYQIFKKLLNYTNLPQKELLGSLIFKLHVFYYHGLTDELTTEDILTDLKWVMKYLKKELR